MDSEICFIQKNLTASQIYNYFVENMELFFQTLSERVDVTEYSEKISKNALHFCAYYNKELAGLLACYFNQPIKEFGFVTTISVPKKFQNKGIAKRLMTEATEYAKKNGFRKIKLEVNRSNLTAISMYNGLGFILIKKTNDRFLLELSI